MKLNKSLNQLNTIIIKATIKDKDILLELCKQNFPKNWKWQRSSSSAVRWWDYVLNSESAEVWVIKSSIIVGFCVMIVNIDKWENEKKYRDSSIKERIFESLRHPHFLLKQMKDKISNILLNYNTITTLDSHQYNNNLIMWLELIAIDKHHRKKGYAQKLLELAARTALSHNKQIIKLRVVKDNKSAITLYKNFGFKCSAIESKGYLFIKKL